MFRSRCVKIKNTLTMACLLIVNFGGWVWSDGIGIYQCELELCDLDSDAIDPVGYVSIVPLEDGTYFIDCWLPDEKFRADEKIFTSKNLRDDPAGKGSCRFGARIRYPGNSNSRLRKRLVN
jgi:hypothetical protein